MIIYTEYGIRLHEFIKESGHSLTEKDGVWISSDDVAVQAIINNYDPLPPAQADAKERLGQHASSLVHNIYPFVDAEKSDAIGIYNFATDIYSGGLPLPNRLQQLKDIRDTYIIKRDEIDALTDWELADAYDVTVGW